jgi:hypothetical protein
MSTRDNATGSPINPWIIAMTVMLATFMEVLDTSVVNGHAQRAGAFARRHGDRPDHATGWLPAGESGGTLAGDIRTGDSLCRTI